MKREGKEKISGKSGEKIRENSRKLVPIVMAVIMFLSISFAPFSAIVAVNETVTVTPDNETTSTPPPDNETVPASSPEPTLSPSPTPSLDNKNDYRGAIATSSIHTTTVAPLAVEWGQCGPIDLVIVLDDTASMAGAIDNIKAELPNVIATANNASGGDLRVGYITFKDSVTVHNSLTTNISAVMDSINATVASGGAGGPEASDEAKNTAVNNLPAGTRTDAAGYNGTQTGDFTTPYRDNATKIVVLITDAPPGGFNDIQDSADNASMHTHAVTAASKGILISDVFVPTGGDYAGQAAILEDDANTTGGIFITTAADGTGTGAAINEIVARCGVAPPTLTIEVEEDELLINGTTTVAVTSSAINETVNLTLNATAVSNGDTLAEYNLTIGPDGKNTTILTAGSTPHAGMITAEIGNVTANVTYSVDKLYLDVTVTDKVLTKGMGTLAEVNIKNPTDQAVDDIKVYFDVCSPDSTHTTLANWEPLAVLPGHTTVTPYTVKYEVQGREIYVRIEDSSGTIVKEYGPFATGEKATSTPFTFLAKIKYLSETQTEDDDELVDLITLTQPGKVPVVNITDIVIIAPNGDEYTNLLAYPWDEVRYNVTLTNPSNRGNITYTVKIDDPANHIAEDIEIPANTTITKTLTISSGLTEGKKLINVSVTSGTAKVAIGKGFDVVMPHANFTIENVDTGEKDTQPCINATRGQTIRVTYLINNTGNYDLGDDVGEPSGTILFRIASSDGKVINLDQSMLLIEQGLTTIQKTYTIPTTGELGIYKVKAGFRMGKGIAPGPVLSAETQAKINEAIDKGLEYLRNTQNPDGSWGSWSRVGRTSLAVLAFLGHGIDESDPDVSAGIDYILTRVQADGSIYDDYKTYETACAIMALARTNNPAYETVINDAKDWLVSSQWDESCLWGSVNEDNWYYGGFGYGYHSRPDLSNTQFALVALKAAGLPEDDETWDKAIIFLQRCQNRAASNDQWWAGNDGGFIYYPGTSLAGGTTSYGSMTAAGIWALRLCDVPAEDGRVEDALKWFDTNYAYDTNPNMGSEYYHYYLWSAAKAFILCDITDRYGLKTPTNPGDEKGWYYDFASYLIDTQQPNGQWLSSGCGDIVDTSFALLVLERELGIVILKGDEANFCVDVDEVQLSELEIEPNPAGIGENVTVSFNVTRVGPVFDNEFGNEIWFEPSVVVPLPTGDLEIVEEERSIESPHPYPSDYDEIWVITKPGAEQIRVHFDHLETAESADKVWIYDGDDNLIATYYYYWGSFWTPWVTGDTIKVRLTSDYDERTDYGFSIDSIQFKRPELIPHEYNGDMVSIAPDNTTRVNVTIPGLDYTGTYDVIAFVDVYLKEDGNYFNYSVGPDVHGDDYLYGDFEVREPARIIVTDLEVPGLVNGSESFTVNVTVENIGGLRGNDIVEVNITDAFNESIIYGTNTSDVTLNAGENTTVQLQFIASSEEGRYAVIAQTLDTEEPVPDDDEIRELIGVRNIFATDLTLSSDEDVRMTSYRGETSTLAVHHGDNLTCEVVLENFGANETTETLTIGVYLVIPYYPSYGRYEISVMSTPEITPIPTPVPIRPPYSYIEKIPVLTKNREITLASGENTTEVFDLVVPYDAPNGLYILRAWTHDKGVQTPNNIADWWSQLGPYETSGQLSVGYGEVEITDIEAKPGIVDAMGFVNIRITVKNTGDAKITDMLLDKQYYPLIVNISSNITTTCHAKEIGVLYPGQKRTISFIFFNTEEYGRYDVNATVDASSYGLAGFEYIYGGWNGILETPISGDDYVYGEIYPGPNGELDSVPAGDDYIDWDWWEDEYYINPGVNNILETPVSGDDIVRGVILPGENGVIDSVPGGDDEVSMEIVPASVDTRSTGSTVFYVASFDVNVSNATIITGIATNLTVNVTSIFDETPIDGAEVTLDGAGVAMTNTTNSSGIAIFTDVNATKSGIIKVIAAKGDERGIAIINAITVTEFDPADTNKDRVVSMVELMIAIGKWKAGTYSMTDLMRSIARWKAGSY